MPNKSYKIVCFGDSTTDSTFYASDEKYVKDYNSLKVYSKHLEEELPNLLSADVKVINSGISGDTTLDAKLRFQKDVLNHNPDCVIIQFGANDQSIRQDYNLNIPIVTKEQFVYNMLYFINKLKKINANIILMTPGIILLRDHFKSNYFKEPYNLKEKYGMNGHLKNYVEFVRKLAVNENVALIDVYNEQLQFGKKNDLNSLLPDGLHPNNKGHKFIADLLVSKYFKNLKL